MSAEDPTKRPADDELNTEPMLETILERVNALRDEVREFRDQQNANVESLRKDFLAAQHRVERQISVLNDQFLKIRTDQTLIEDRLDQIETKAS
jgi:hypothetical protein